MLIALTPGLRCWNPPCSSNMAIFGELTDRDDLILLADRSSRMTIEELGATMFQK